MRMKTAAKDNLEQEGNPESFVKPGFQLVLGDLDARGEGSEHRCSAL